MRDLGTVQAEADSLAGRPVEVQQLANGQFVAEWMRFDAPPPKAAASREEALQNLIDHIRSLPEIPPFVEEANPGSEARKI